jgi:hypothetical protein
VQLADEQQRRLNTPVKTPIWEALAKGPKTFLEQRSWLHILLAFRRLVDFHVVTFHVLAVLAFWELLIWDWPYALQLLTSAFMTLNALGILWVVLEIWSSASVAQTTAGPCEYPVGTS